MSDRCTGHCCKRFYLPWNPEELQKMIFNEEDIIKPMVIPIGPYTNGQLNVSGQPIVDSSGKTGYYYTCKHHQTNGDCGIYETRPAMCRDYPYGESCKYKDCEWDAVKLRILTDENI